jgi:hypothetical protein
MIQPQLMTSSVLGMRSAIFARVARPRSARPINPPQLVECLQQINHVLRKILRRLVKQWPR